MVKANWERIQQIFFAAVDLPPAERQSFLDFACHGEEELMSQVRSLLHADLAANSQIATAIASAAQDVLSLERNVRAGPYRLIRELGRGGMGTVYEAARDDAQFEQRVAVKLIRRGMDTEDVLRRFRHERQILAHLEHPYIARLVDGGTASDGRPYFVMEFVEGRPLDDYCRAHRLAIRARLQLFLKVCAATAYAHRNLVVHRDLKPGNILVTADGAPKLLDFGVAKLLDPSTGHTGETTALFMRPFTPDYASPEQVQGEAITTATDVYSLGAILYQLLSGSPPFRFTGTAQRELEQMICETDPPKLRDAAPGNSRQLTGDLEAIVSRAMRKEPEQRYGSVEQFAADIERHLSGRAVLARQGNATYRALKFARRNRLALLVGTAFTLALLGATVTATRLAVRAEHEEALAEEARQSAVANQTKAEASRREAEFQAGQARQKTADALNQQTIAVAQRTIAETQRALAEHRFEQVRQLAGKFLFDFHDAIARLPGSTSARKMVMETGLKYYDTLVTEAGTNSELLKEIARGYDRLGDVQGNPYYANLGDMPGAIASYQKAALVRGRVHDNSPEFVSDRIRGTVRLAQVMAAQGSMKQAESLLLDIFKSAGSNSDAAQPETVREALAQAYGNLGDVQIRMGVHGKAVEPYLKLLALSEQLVRERDSSSDEKRKRDAQTGLSLGHTKLGDVYFRLSRSADAMKHLRLALEIDERLSSSDPQSIPLLRKLYVDYSFVGRVLRSAGAELLGKAGEAEASLRRAVALADQMAAADPNNSLALMDVAMSASGLGDFLRHNASQNGSNDSLPEALASYRKGVTAVEQLRSLGPLNQNTEDGLIQLHQRYASGLADAGQYEEALHHVTLAEQYLDAVEKREPGRLREATRRAETTESRAEIFMAQKRWADARAATAQVISRMEDWTRRDSLNAFPFHELPRLWMQMAELQEHLSRNDLSQNDIAHDDPAIQAIRSALDRWHELEARHWFTPADAEGRDKALSKLHDLETRAR